jgi:hypothetical protein
VPEEVPRRRTRPRPGASPACRLGLSLLLLTVLPASSPAEWLVVPGVGIAFGGGTNLIDLERAAATGAKLSFQGSVLWLGEGWFGPLNKGFVVGVEGEVGTVPAFFGDRDLVTSSNVVTARGSLVIAAPLSLTGHSLRPYASAGFGLIRATSDDFLNVLAFEENLMGLRFGGGAIGFLTDTVGVRWDVSYLRTLKGLGDPENNAIGAESRSLHFWRGSMGLVLRF